MDSGLRKAWIRIPVLPLMISVNVSKILTFLPLLPYLQKRGAVIGFPSQDCCKNVVSFKVPMDCSKHSIKVPSAKRKQRNSLFNT